MQTWKQIQARFPEGRTCKDGAYSILSTDDKGISLARVATDSRVRITRKMVEKASARLEAGEFIERRTISYTVAIETLVILALGSSVQTVTEDGTQGYRRASK